MLGALMVTRHAQPWQREKEALRKRVKDLKAQIAKHEEAVQRLEAERGGIARAWDEERGPDRLNRRVEDFRRHGRKMGFSIRVRRVSGSLLAQSGAPPT